MNFQEIKADSKVFPGEYLLHEPTMTIVVCGAYNKKENFIRCLGNGKIFNDTIEKFKKINLTAEERKTQRHSKCKGCSGGGQ